VSIGFLPHRDGVYRWLRTELKLLVDSRGIPMEIIGYLPPISAILNTPKLPGGQQFEQERLVSAILTTSASLCN
jgi:hypothetical protein